MTATYAKKRRDAEAALIARQSETLAFYADRFDEALSLWLHDPNVSFLLKLEVHQRYQGNMRLFDDAMAQIWPSEPGEPEQRTPIGIISGPSYFAAIYFVNECAKAALEKSRDLVPEAAVLPGALMVVLQDIARRDTGRRNQQG